MTVPITVPITVPVPVPAGVAGRVDQFDDATGLGYVTDPQGTRYRFHCVSIADGTRTIQAGAPVSFVVVPRFGEYEATAVTHR